MTVRDFPSWVVEQIEEEEDGETATTTNFALVVTLMARLGAALKLWLDAVLAAPATP